MQNDINTLRKILTNYKTIAVVGLSAKWHQPSFFVAKYMQENGYRIVPVNPKYAESTEGILGEKCYASLLDIPFPVDMVNIFRNSKDVLPIAEQAVLIGAKCLWQQLNVENEEAKQLAKKAGLDSVINRCIKIEHIELFGDLQ
jgi:predicted CoA-binding protein